MAVFQLFLFRSGMGAGPFDIVTLMVDFSGTAVPGEGVCETMNPLGYLGWNVLWVVLI